MSQNLPCQDNASAVLLTDLLESKNLRQLETMTDDEAQECLVEVFNVLPHAAYMDVEGLRQYLIKNIEFELGVEDTEDLPFCAFAVTPQTYFNLTVWLLRKKFDLFGFIN